MLYRGSTGLMQKPDQQQPLDDNHDWLLCAQRQHMGYGGDPPQCIRPQQAGFLTEGVIWNWHVKIKPHILTPLSLPYPQTRLPSLQYDMTILWKRKFVAGGQCTGVSFKGRVVHKSKGVGSYVQPCPRTIYIYIYDTDHLVYHVV